MSRAVVVRVGQLPEIVEIDSFDEARTIIGGYVERVRMGTFDVLCDEDGMRKKLPVNRTIRAGQIAQYNQILLGTFVVTKLTNVGLGSLTADEVKQVVRLVREGV